MVAAGQLLAHLLDGVVTLDAGEVSGRHDLDVSLADGTVVAVEVTTHAVEYPTQTQGEVSKRGWDYPELTRHLWLSMDQPTTITWTRSGHAPGIDVPALHEGLPDPLLRLESLVSALPERISRPSA